MESTLSKKLKITLLTVGLSAAVPSASAVTDITFCDEINPLPTGKTAQGATPNSNVRSS